MDESTKSNQIMTSDTSETWRHITKDFRVPTNGTSEATILIPEPTVAGGERRVALNVWGRSLHLLSPPYVFWPTQVRVQWTVFSVVLINDVNGNLKSEGISACQLIERLN